MAKYLDQTGLAYFWKKIKAILPGPIQAYQVGSIYMSISYGFDPNNSFGGTWTKIAEGQCLIQAGNTYALGSTGGEETHRLTVNEMPSHNHKVDLVNNVNSGTEGHSSYWGHLGTTKFNTNSVGGNAAHNNMPPYLAVNIWQRIR